MSIRKVLITFIAVVLFFCLFAFYFLTRQYVAPILMYHSINPQQNPAIKKLIVSPATFQRQMSFLKRCKYNVLPLEDMADMIKNKQKIPPRTVCITFDDGYKDVFIYAFPVLKRYNFPAAVFLITNEINRSDRLSWDEIKEMQDTGLITFGSHTLGPQPLIDIGSQEEVKRQIVESKKVLESKLSRRVAIFSYPEGKFNDRIKQMVIDAGYKIAVTTSPKRKYPSDDIFALKRLKITENAANMFIFAVETSGLYTFMKEYRNKGHNAKEQTNPYF